jgi:hypothetical protein
MLYEIGAQIFAAVVFGSWERNSMLKAAYFTSLYMYEEWKQFTVVAYGMSQYNLWLVSRHSFLPSFRYKHIIQQHHYTI